MEQTGRCTLRYLALFLLIKHKTEPYITPSLSSWSFHTRFLVPKHHIDIKLWNETSERIGEARVFIFFIT